MVADSEAITRVKQLIRHHPRGLTITEIARHLHLNRNVVAKYLDILLISGNVEMKQYGSAKVYTLSHRIPLTAMLSFHDDLILILNEKDEIVQINEELLRLIRRSREEIIGTRLEDAGLPLVSNPEVIRAAGAPDSNQALYRVCRDKKTGGDLYLRMRFIPTVFEGGERGTTILMENITEQKRAEQQLEESEARYRAIVEDQDELICRFLPDFTVTYANPACMRFLCAAPEELAGSSFLQPIADADRDTIEGGIRSLSHELPKISLNLRIAPAGEKAGEPRWLGLTAHGIFDEAGRLVEVQVSGRDVTCEKELKTKKQEYIRNTEFLAKTAMEFVNVLPEMDIYRIIGERLHELEPDALIVVSSFNPETEVFLTRWIGDEQKMIFIQRVLGREDPCIHTTGSDPNLKNTALRDLTRIGRFHHLSIPLSVVLSFAELSPEAIAMIEREFGRGEIYVGGLTWGGELFGCVGLLLKEGESLEDEAVINSFIHQASIALRRKKADDALRQSQMKCRTITEISSDCILMARVDGTIVEANHACTTLLSLDHPEGAAGENVLTFIAEASKDDFAAALAAAANGEAPDIAKRYRMAACPGYTRMAEAQLVPIAFGQGQALLIALHDRTEEGRFDDYRDLIAGLFGALDDAVVDMTAAGVIVAWNPATERMFGFAPAELPARSLTDLLPFYPPSEVEALLNRLLRSEPIPAFETKSIRKDGRIIDISVTISSTGNAPAAEFCIAAVIRDITLQKEQERELLMRSSALGSLEEALMLVNLRSLITYVNQSFLLLWGYRHEDDILGKTLEQFSREIGAPGLMIQARNAVMDREGWSGCFTVYGQGKGPPRHIKAMFSLVRGDLNIPLCMVGIFVERPAR